MSAPNRRKKSGDPSSWVTGLIVAAGTALAVGIGYLLGAHDAEAERQREERVAEANRAQRQQQSASCSASPPAQSGRPVRLLNPDGTPYDSRAGSSAAAAASNSSAGGGTNHDDEAHLCKVCLDAPNDHLFTPCGHQVACGLCASQCTVCPICREEVVRVVKVYKC